MKLILSLSVLAVALLVVLAGPAPVQANSSLTEDLTAFGNEMVKKVQSTFENLNWDWFHSAFGKVKEKIEGAFS